MDFPDSGFKQALEEVGERTKPSNDKFNERLEEIKKKRNNPEFPDSGFNKIIKNSKD